MEVGTHRLVWMEWRPADGLCLPLLIFPCTIKSRSSLLAPAHPCGPRKKGRKMVVVVVVLSVPVMLSCESKLIVPVENLLLAYSNLFSAQLI